MGFAARVMVLIVVGLTSGCSPTFDWREARPAEGLLALFPCRPQSSVRPVMLAGERVEMELLACTAGSSVFAISRIEVDDPGRIEPLLEAMRQALLINLSLPAAAANVDPAPGSGSAVGRLGGQHVAVSGSGPEGQPLKARGEFFSHRGSIYQATVVGSKPDPEAADFFFASLQVH